MRKYFCLMIASATVLFGCKPETLPDIGDPTRNLPLLEGNWKVEKVVQSDLNAVRYGFPYKEVDVTTKAPFTDFKLAFAMNNGTPSNFTTTPGGAPKIIPIASGGWKVDDPTLPKEIALFKAPDTIRLTLVTYKGLSGGQLHLRQVKYQGVKPTLQYDYYFRKQ